MRSMFRSGTVRGSRAWIAPTLVVLGALLAFGVHFRPWEGGLLEEWALARDWQVHGGWSVLAAYVEWSFSRPLHLLPTMLGLAISGGSPGGIFAIMGLVAAGQFLAVMWALRPVSRSFWVSMAVALFVALHPLWPAGFLQRFLPAQFAALGLFIALGLVIRWLQRGQVRWLIGTCIALIVGFAAYQGPAVVAPLMAVVISLAVPSSWPRKLLAVGAVTGSTLLVALYSIVIVRLVTPAGQSSYELSNIEQAVVKSPRELLHYIAGTYLNYGSLLVLGILAVVILAAVLSLTRAIPHWAGWLMAGVALVSPVSAIVFFGSIAWLQDIDRIGYTTSLALGVALIIWPATAVARPSRLETVFAALLVVVAVAGCVIGIGRWQPYIATQQQLLGALAPIVHEAEGDDAVVVVDSSGTFGYLYTFPLQYLQGASIVANMDQTKVLLCFPTPSQHPLPSGGIECDPSPTGLDLRPAGTLAMPGGNVDFYVGSVDMQEFSTKEFK